VEASRAGPGANPLRIRLATGFLALLEENVDDPEEDVAREADLPGQMPATATQQATRVLKGRKSIFVTALAGGV